MCWWGLASSCPKTWLPSAGAVEPGRPLQGFDSRVGGRVVKAPTQAT